MHFFFFSVFCSRVSGCTGRTSQQPTSFAEHPDGQLSAGDAPLARSPAHVGCKGWPKRGQPGHPPLPHPIPGRAGEAEAIPAGDIMDATHPRHTRLQTASALCWTSVSCSARLKEEQGQAKPVTPPPRPVPAQQQALKCSASGSATALAALQKGLLLKALLLPEIPKRKISPAKQLKSEPCVLWVSAGASQGGAGVGAMPQASPWGGGAQHFAERFTSALLFPHFLLIFPAPVPFPRHIPSHSR